MHTQFKFRRQCYCEDMSSKLCPDANCFVQYIPPTTSNTMFGSMLITPQIFSICNACNGKDIYLSSCSMCLCMLAIIKSDLSLLCGLCLGRLWSSVLFQKEHTYIWPIKTKTRFTFTYNVVGEKKSRHETPTTATTTSLQKNHKRL